MELQKGDRVLVNVAPFIGSLRRNEESIPCQVVEANGDWVEVCTEPPYKRVALWIRASWIEDLLQPADESASPCSESIAASATTRSKSPLETALP